LAGGKTERRADWMMQIAAFAGHPSDELLRETGQTHHVVRSHNELNVAKVASRVGKFLYIRWERNPHGNGQFTGKEHVRACPTTLL